MTLIVTKQILTALDCCASGINTFEERIGDRNAMDYQEFLELAFEMEKTLPEEKYVYYTLHLRTDPKFYLLQGAYKMTDKYQVFNNKNGQYETFTNLEAAVARRQELINEFIESNKTGLFGINREILVNEGKDAMWVSITDSGSPL